MDLLCDDDRQKLYRMLKEMLGPLMCDRFIIVGFTPEDDAFVVQIRGEHEAQRDPLEELMRVIEGEKTNDFTL